MGITAAGSLAAAAKMKMPQVLTVIGGAHVSALPRDTLEEFPFFDVGVYGEGEITFLELLSGFSQSKHALTKIAGTVIRENGSIRLNPPRPLIRDLDKLPPPDWSLLSGFPRIFKPGLMRVRHLPCCSLVLTRGCPNKCIFCDRSVFGSVCRSYSPPYAFDMIAELYTKFGVREILIEDDTFIVNRVWVVEFCGLLLERKLNISWSCLGRADRVDLDLLKLMKKSGCWNIAYGIESGDESILKAMRKNLTIDQVDKALHWSKEAGLKTRGFFMVGFPGETKESLKVTVDVALRLPLDDISVMQVTPFPGSALYSTASQFGVFEKNWRLMTTLNTVFVPHGLSKQDLMAARDKLTSSFYLRPIVIARKIFQVIRSPFMMISYFRIMVQLLKSLVEGFYKSVFR